MTFSPRTHASPHLSFRELACHDAARTPYPAEWIHSGRVYVLAEVFEAIRAAAGHKPITVLSAYRTPAHNAAVGGAPGSQHLHGRALDLRPPAGMSVGTFHRIIRELAPTLPALKGIGRYRTFVHVDTRPAVRMAVWQGPGVNVPATA